jgi:hypothetical protein
VVQYATQADVASLRNSLTDLSAKVQTLQQSAASNAELKSYYDQLKAEVDTLNAQNGGSSPIVQQLQRDVVQLQQIVSQLQSSINDVEAKVEAAKLAQEANSVVIGANSINVNGLQVTFLTNSVYVAGATDTIARYAQMSVRISNTNTYSINNIDIVGSITFSVIPYNVASPCPTLTDSGGQLNYVGTYNGSNIYNFECYSYSTAGTALSLPAGGSITLRPRIGLLAIADNVIPPLTTTLSISTIVYDKGA